MRLDIRVPLLAGIFIIGQSLASASILTFDACGGSATAAILNSCFGGAINQGYGDRVTGLSTDAGGTQDRSYGNGGEGFTPNILTSYNTGFGWDTGFGTLANVMYVDGITAVLNMTFSADAGFRAQLLGFSLGAFLPPSGGYNGVNVSIRDQSNSLLFNQTYSVGATDINQLLNVQSGVGGSLTLSLDVSALGYDPQNFIFDRESIAIDNVRFAQRAEINSGQLDAGQIPEPSTFALIGGAALVAALYRRRRRSGD